MKIRLKLIVLVFGILLAFLANLTLIMKNVRLSDRIGREQSVITEVMAGFHFVSLESTKLFTYDLKTSEEDFALAAENLSGVSERLEDLSYLPVMSEALGESFEILGNLFVLQNEGIRLAKSAVIRIKDLYTDISGFDFQYAVNFQVSDIPLIEVAVEHPRYGELIDARKDLDRAIKGLNSNSSVGRILEQNELINLEIELIQGRIFRTTIVLSIITVVSSLILAYIISRSILNPILGIRGSVEEMRSGDLTIEFPAKRRDEIGLLAGDLELFNSELKKSITNIKNASEDNSEIRESLMGTVEQTSSSVREIGMNMESMQHQFSSLDDSVVKSVESIGQIQNVISEESEQIQDQIAMVEESTASVTQMIASIRSVAQITQRNVEAAEELVSTAQSGGDRLSITTGLISTVNDNVEDIKNMADLIQSISGQTNLLAMNAAIEAAHAGEAGRGFAVVADEIRKLAEMSSQSSSDITQSLNTIVDRISQAGESADHTTAAFTRINSQVNTVEGAFMEISDSMKELETGSTQILEAMQRLQDVSQTVSDGSVKMDDASKTVFATINEVRRVSDESLSSIAEVSHGTKKIGHSVDILVNITQQIQDVSRHLEEAVAFFKLESSADGA